MRLPCRNEKTAKADIRERFGFAVKVRREELGLTQEDLADRASIHVHSTLSLGNPWHSPHRPQELDGDPQCEELRAGRRGQPRSRTRSPLHRDLRLADAIKNCSTGTTLMPC